MIFVYFLIILSAKISQSSDWSAHMYNGRTYYFNAKSGLTQWDVPDDLRTARTTTTDLEQHDTTKSVSTPQNPSYFRKRLNLRPHHTLHKPYSTLSSLDSIQESEGIADTISTNFVNNATTVEPADSIDDVVPKLDMVSNIRKQNYSLHPAGPQVHLDPQHNSENDNSVYSIFDDVAHSAVAYSDPDPDPDVQASSSRVSHSQSNHKYQKRTSTPDTENLNQISKNQNDESLSNDNSEPISNSGLRQAPNDGHVWDSNDYQMQVSELKSRMSQQAVAMRRLQNKFNTLNNRYKVVSDNLMKSERNRKKLLKKLKSHPNQESSTSFVRSDDENEYIHSSKIEPATTLGRSAKSDSDAGTDLLAGKSTHKLENFSDRIDSVDLDSTVSNDDVVIDSDESNKIGAPPYVGSVGLSSTSAATSSDSHHLIEYYQLHIQAQENELLEAYLEIENMKLDLKNLAVPTVLRLRKKSLIGMMLDILNPFLRKVEKAGLSSKQSKRQSSKKIMSADVLTKEQLKTKAHHQVVDSAVATVTDLMQSLSVLRNNYTNLELEFELKNREVENLQSEITRLESKMKSFKIKKRARVNKEEGDTHRGFSIVDIQNIEKDVFETDEIVGGNITNFKEADSGGWLSKAEIETLLEFLENSEATIEWQREALQSYFDDTEKQIETMTLKLQEYISKLFSAIAQQQHHIIALLLNQHVLTVRLNQKSYENSHLIEQVQSLKSERDLISAQYNDLSQQYYSLRNSYAETEIRVSSPLVPVSSSQSPSSVDINQHFKMSEYYAEKKFGLKNIRFIVSLVIPTVIGLTGWLAWLWNEKNQK